MFCISGYVVILILVRVRMERCKPVFLSIYALSSRRWKLIWNLVRWIMFEDERLDILKEKERTKLWCVEYWLIFSEENGTMWHTSTSYGIRENNNANILRCVVYWLVFFRIIMPWKTGFKYMKVTEEEVWCVGSYVKIRDGMIKKDRKNILE